MESRSSDSGSSTPDTSSQRRPPLRKPSGDTPSTRPPSRKQSEETVQELQYEREATPPGTSQSTLPGKGRAIVGGTQSHQKGKLDIVAQSTLSPLAPEFVPRSAAMHSNHWEGGDTGQQPWSSGSMTEWTAAGEIQQMESDPVYQAEKAIVSLISMPGSFEEVVRSLLQTLDTTVTNAAALEQIVELIFQHALTELNFQYTAARLCNYLCQHWKVNENGTFRQHLLKRCHQEHLNREETQRSPDGEARLMGFTFFMAELFLQMEVNGQKIEVLARAVRELLLTILSQPTDGNLKSAVQILKLTGAALEDTERTGSSSQACPQLDQIFQGLREETINDHVSKSVKKQLLYVIELRASNWGRIEPTSPPATPVLPSNTILTPYQQMEPVFYNSMGQQITREEAGFGFIGDAVVDGDYPVWQDPLTDGSFPSDQWDDGYNPQDESMDDEIAAAYEQFVLEGQ